MKDWQSQSHFKWDCKYHVVILPKYRQRVLVGNEGSRPCPFFGNCADNKKSVSVHSSLVVSQRCRL